MRFQFFTAAALVFPSETGKMQCKNQTLLSSSRFCFALLCFFTPFSSLPSGKKWQRQRLAAETSKTQTQTNLVDVLLNHVGRFLILTIKVQITSGNFMFMRVIKR
jgi:hypothetical protein